MGGWGWTSRLNREIGVKRLCAKPSNRPRFPFEDKHWHWPTVGYHSLLIIMRLYTLAVLSVFTEFPLSVTFSSRAITRSLNKRHRSKRSDGKGKREGEREQKSARSWIDLIPPFLFSPSGYRFSDKLFGPPFSKRISLGNFQRRDTIDPFSTARFDSSTEASWPAGWEFDGRTGRRGTPVPVLYRFRENLSRGRCAARSEFGAM